MSQGARTRQSLRELRSDLTDLRDFLRKPLPTEYVIAPAPPPVTNSGTALARARAFLLRLIGR